MKDAAADLEFETAARLRDEIKRLRETELSSPTIRWRGRRRWKRARAASRASASTAPRRTCRRRPQRRAAARAAAGSSRIKDPAVDYPGPRPENPVPRRDGDASRISDTYEPVQPTYAQSSSQPAPSSRIKKPSLDDMGPGHRPADPGARDPKIDPRVKAGAFGEQVRGPHKPTLDEMGPHASLAVKKGSGSLPQKPDLIALKPTRTVEFDDPAEVKGRRAGRADRPAGALERCALLFDFRGEIEIEELRPMIHAWAG